MDRDIQADPNKMKITIITLIPDKSELGPRYIII
jgi:hypothetical protein